jgi:NAD(P)H dehydrogenase (quinone)
MPEVSLILAHPDKKSFNHAVAAAASDILRKNNYRVHFHDLYAENFQPSLPAAELRKEAELPSEIQKYSTEIVSSDGIIVVHPNWWGEPPAILKGWVDRVLRAGTAYKFLEGDAGEGIPAGLLKAKAAIVFNTSNTPRQREQEVFGDPLETLWKNCIFGLCGVNNFCRRNFGVIVTSTLDQRKQWLEDVVETVNRYFPRG